MHHLRLNRGDLGDGRAFEWWHSPFSDGMTSDPARVTPDWRTWSPRARLHPAEQAIEHAQQKLDNLRRLLEEAGIDSGLGGPRAA